MYVYLIIVNYFYLFFECLVTTRPQRVLEENGQSYWFTDREKMEEDIRNNRFLEYGEYNGHLYGTHLDSIRDVIKQVSYQNFYLVYDNFYILFRAKCVY